MKQAVSKNAGDVKAVRAETKKARLKLEQEREEMRNTLASPDGRAVVWRILEQCGIYRSSFQGEALTMAFNEGKRQIGLWLLSELQQANPGAYLAMQRDKKQGEDQ